MKEIPLTRGLVALVDDEDYDELSKHNWCCTTTGYAIRSFTPRKRARQKQVSMHADILGKKEGFEIDHINGDKLDNRRSNIRHVTHRQNIQNKKPNKNTSSRYKGVHLGKSGNVWLAAIEVGGKFHHVGSYNSETDAAIAYNKAALEYCGEYAWLNVIEQGGD